MISNLLRISPGVNQITTKLLLRGDGDCCLIAKVDDERTFSVSGPKLRAARRAAGLSMESLGQVVGRTSGLIYKAEKSSSWNFFLSAKGKLAAALNIPESEIEERIGVSSTTTETGTPDRNIDTLGMIQLPPDLLGQIQDVVAGTRDTIAEWVIGVLRDKLDGPRLRSAAKK